MMRRARLLAFVAVACLLVAGASTLRPTWSAWTDATNNAGVSMTVAPEWQPPVVQSIDRLDSTPTNAATAHWTVTFSESVAGVGAGDFDLARSGGLSGGAISSVTGSGTTYIITTTTGSGDGVLRLNLVDDDSISDAATNELGGDGTGNGNFTGQAYTLDRTEPTGNYLAIFDMDGDGKIDRVLASFSEATVASTATAPWTLTGVPSGGTVSSVYTSGTIVVVDLTEGAADPDTAVGAMTVALAASPSGIRDAAGNQASFGAVAPLDAAPPAILASGIGDANGNGKFDYALVAFSEVYVSSTATAPWTLAGVPSGGTISGVVVGAEALVGLNIAEGPGAADTAAGSMTIALAASPTGIRDAAGNQTRFAPAAPADGAAPVKTGQQMLDFDADGKVDRVTTTFSETLASSTLATQWTLANVPSAGTLASVSTSGSVATAIVNEGAGTADTAVGTLTVALAANASGIRDASGNQSSFLAAPPSDKAGPVPLTVTSGPGTTAGRIQTGDSVVANFSEAIASGLPVSTPITESALLGGNERLTIAGFTDGALDMGSTNYVTGTVSVGFAATSTRTNLNKTVTILVGTCSTSCTAVATGTGTWTYAPAPTLLDAAGNAAAGSRITGLRIF